MIDLTPSIQAALTRREGWRWDTISDRLREFAQSEGFTFDCDPGAGEGWARILVGERAVGLIWTKVPFAFVDPRQASLVRLLKGAEIEIVELSDFEAPVLRLDLDRASSVIERGCWPDAVVPHRMSASDLWWATV